MSAKQKKSIDQRAPQIGYEGITKPPVTRDEELFSDWRTFIFS